MRAPVRRAADVLRRAPAPWEREAPAETRLPGLLQALAVSTVLALAGPFTLFGFRLSGWAWALALAFALERIVHHPRLVRFPWAIWAPWVAMLGARLAVTDFPAAQRTVQLLVPLLVGIAVSTLRPSEELIRRVRAAMRPALVVLLVLMVVRSGILLTLRIPETTGFAAESMVAAFLAVVYAVEWTGGDRRALRWWLGAVAVTLFAVARTAIAATVLALPASFGRMPIARRAAVVAAAALVGLAVFASERVQHKSFAGGRGGIEDVLGEEFRDSGRFGMWRLFRERIAERPWLGWGAGGGQAYARQITKGQLAYPHNDWLQHTFDYGYLGSGLFLLTALLATGHAARAARGAGGGARVMLLVGASGFPVFWVLMYGDNALIYGPYYANLHFALLGLGYGALAREGGGGAQP